MDFKVAVILTTYNRPRLVVDAIESVFEQSEKCRLYIMDDGSNEESRRAIWSAVGRKSIFYPPTGASPRLPIGDLSDGHSEVAWWMGPDRSATERKATISYSRSINFALNYLVREPYICYLVDDDYLYPDSVRVRAEFLATHQDQHVVYGRQRSVQYEQGGSFNVWSHAGPPSAGRYYPIPKGRWEPGTKSKGGRYYFEDGITDPETSLTYVEEAFWQAGDLVYGQDGMTDHNQVMNRRECLTGCQIPWLVAPADLGGVQYWGESVQWGVGDYAFFKVLGAVHHFHAVDAWVATKRYHGRNDGSTAGEQRE